METPLAAKYNPIIDGISMNRSQNEHNAKVLWGLIAIAVVVRIIYYIDPLITNIPELDGLLVVFLGFYICSRAAANFLNMILFELGTRWRVSLAQADVIKWIGLNALVMLSGLMLVLTGMYRFFSRAF